MAAELEVFEKILPVVENGGVVETESFSEEEQAIMRRSQLLSTKPVIYSANVNEDELADPSQNVHLQKLRAHAAKENREVVVISAQIEAELSAIGCHRETRVSGITGSQKLRCRPVDRSRLPVCAWSLILQLAFRKLAPGPLLADDSSVRESFTVRFQKGFIGAEVMTTTVACGGEKGAKDKGVMRLEGREYLMKDGDVVHFRFNV